MSSPAVVTAAMLAPRGRATRQACEGGRVLWRVAATDDPVRARIVALGVGDVIESGLDDTGAWWVTGASAPTLADVTDATPMAWRRAIALVAALADVCASCERAAVYPGPIDPAHLVVDGDALIVPAEALIAALVGAPASATVATAGARWLAPEQVAGRPGDNAANRYTIGLVLYRLIAGEHPFAGAGLRRGLDDQAGRGAPPLADEVATELPPGLQSYCLRLLEPEAARRPTRAAEIATALRAFAAAEPVPMPMPVPMPVPVPVTGTTPVTESGTGSASVAASGSASVVARLVPALIAIAGAIIALVILADRAPRAARARVRVPPAHGLDAPQSVADCATCHAQHASEWSRSVMAHAGTSPLFGALEILIEEQVGRDRDCPGGAGVLRAAGPGACRDRTTGLPITGSGGASWCVNCHTPSENLAASLPPWDGTSASATTRRPLRDLLPASALEGIGCVACHQMTGPVRPGDEDRGGYEGNPAWISPATGQRHAMRPEDARGQPGIANSGYHLEPGSLLAVGDWLPGGAHRRPPASARGYLASSEMCGACHDVRLFGTDALADRGESFKRLRNAYSEWLAWGELERRAGRNPASCQDCHMSQWPAVCEPGPTVDSLDGRACPTGTRPRAVEPGTRGDHAQHYFTGVDVPLGPDFDQAAVDDPTLDVDGVPVGARRRRDLLLASTFRFTLEPPTRSGDRLEIPIVVENVGAGHRVPAGFSQEREIWIHLRVTDATGAVVYEVGRVDRADDDLRDKVFLRIGSSDRTTDRAGRPLGVMGADVADGPDLPRWTPTPGTDGGEQRGRGLVNFQNGFLRCVRCIGTIDADGVCQALPGQDSRRADRFADGDYDADTGACTSNLRGEHAFVEVYFPVGALDATRGVVRGPDAIVDTRSLPPRAPRRSIYQLDALGRGPYTVEARLLFRAFPPYLIRGFADYEREQARLGNRPSGPLIDTSALRRLDIVEIATARAVIP